MKILILSANAGQGHNSAGKAIIEAAEQNDIQAIMLDTFLFQSLRASRMLENLHVKSARYAPRLIGMGNKMAYKMSRPGGTSIVYALNARYGESLYRFIQHNQFDAVIATHIFAAEALTFIKRNYPVSFRSYFVVTDYAVTPFVTETDLDAYFLPHAVFLPLYHANAPGKHFVATGIPVSKDKICKTEKTAAREKLHLGKEEKIIMLTTGSMGYGDLEKVVEALLKQLPPKTRVLAFCGINERLKRILCKRFGRDTRLDIFGYTENMALYYDACDVLMAKPGGLSSTEAAVHEIPLVQMKPIPGWEEDNVAFFEKMGLSANGKTPDMLAAAAIELLNNKEKAAAMQACQKREIPKKAAAAIIETVKNAI